jgi:magnesium-transporting ATPase (P-type)
VAAPFTSRIPSVRAVVDLIRQGRCTLLSALMQQQIMMLESCIAAYTLSALSLHNARSSVSYYEHHVVCAVGIKHCVLSNIMLSHYVELRYRIIAHV